MSSKEKFKRTKIEQDAFVEMKQIFACDNLLDYLDFNEEFKIHTNAIDFLLGSVIIHKAKKIAFYGRKLTIAHNRYTVT